MPVLLFYTSFGLTFAVYVFVQQNISAINSNKILCVVDNLDMPRKLTFDVPFSTRYSNRWGSLWQFLGVTDGITRCECQQRFTCCVDNFGGL
jgi:hypothetical protein